MKQESRFKRLLSQDKVNLFLALCAIIISGASFYATYQQADAAEKQVKAATWPWMQFVTGNVNVAERSREITFKLKNSGAGPALVKFLKYHYDGKEYHDVYEFISSCCFDVVAYEKKLIELQTENPKVDFFSEFGWLLTSFPNNTLVPPGDEVALLTFKQTQYNQKFWQTLNKKRFKLGVEVCYCSILEECYVSNGRGDTRAVKMCAAIPKKHEKPLV